MYQLNPLYDILSESFNKIWNQAQSLSPEARKRYLQHYAMARFGKPDGTINDAATEYAKRYIKGTITHAHKIAKRNGRKLAVSRTNDALSSMSPPYPGNQNFIGKIIKDKKPIRLIKDQHRDSLVIPTLDPKFNNQKLTKPLRQLSSANTVAHEKDELDTMYQLAKKYNMSPGEITTLNNLASIGHTDTAHLPGVLDKEFNRIRLWKLMFDKDISKVVPRSKRDIYWNRQNLDYNKLAKDPRYQKVIKYLKDSGYL